MAGYDNLNDFWIKRNGHSLENCKEPTEKDSLTKDIAPPITKNDVTEIAIDLKQCSPSRKRTSPHNGIGSYVQRIVDDAIMHFEQKRERRTALFYDVVRRGDVGRVKESLLQIQNKDKGTLEWILSVPPQTNSREAGDKNKTTGCSVTKITVMIFLTLATLLSTIVFYALHGLVRMCTKLYTKRDLLTYMDLPYMYALLSENPHILEVFHSYRVDATSSDSLGNNVFHYLTDFAIHDTNKAIRLFQLLMKVEKNKVDLRYLLTETPNRYGLTAQEYMAERGAFVLLRTILHTEGIICEVISGSREDNEIEEQNQNNDITTETETEKGNEISKGGTAMSSCGTLFSTDDNVHDATNPSNNLMEFRMSAFEGKDYGFFRSLVECEHAGERQEQEIISKLKWPLLQLWVTCKVSLFYPVIIVSHLFEIAFTALLIYYLWHTGGDHNAIPLARTLAAVFKQNQLAGVSRTRKYWGAPSVNTQVVMTSAEMFTSAMNSTEECPSYEYTHIGDIVVTSCLKRALDALNNSNYCNNALTMESILRYTGIDHKGNEMLQFIAYYTRPIHLQFLWFSILHVIWDAIHRLVFLWVHLYKKYKGHAYGILAFAHAKFPGSYIGNQLLLLSYVALLRFYMVFHMRYDLLVNTDELSADKNLELFEKLSYLMVACLIARGLYHIYTLRLLPFIGQFVIAMFKMGETLLNFSIVYIAVTLIFSVVFHFMMRRDECPALKKEGFESISDSMFYTFKLLNKHENFPFPHPNPLIIVTYICFTTICCLLLLNLLIASMKIVCTRILREPWLSFLRDMERLNEVISVEFRLMFVRYLLPIRVRRMLHERAGCYVRENKTGDLEVYLRAYENLG